MRDTIVVGVCATGRVVLDCLLSAGREREVIGFLDAGRNGRPRTEVCDGFEVVGNLSDVDALRGSSGLRRAIVGVGEIRRRRELCKHLREAGIELISAVHPTAVVGRGVTMGANVIVAANATVGVGSKVGDGVFLNTACSVDHDCVIGDYAHICPGTHLAGTVTVGAGAWVGIGSNVVQDVTIGEEAFIGAGTVLVGDIPSRVLAYGVPAKVVRELNDDERGRIIS